MQKSDKFSCLKYLDFKLYLSLCTYRYIPSSRHMHPIKPKGLSLGLGFLGTFVWQIYISGLHLLTSQNLEVRKLYSTSLESLRSTPLLSLATRLNILAIIGHLLRTGPRSGGSWSGKGCQSSLLHSIQSTNILRLGKRGRQACFWSEWGCFLDWRIRELKRRTISTNMSRPSCTADSSSWLLMAWPDDVWPVANGGEED